MSAHSSFRSCETRGVRRSPDAEVAAGSGLAAPPLLDEWLVAAAGEADADELQEASGLKLLAE